MKSIIDKKSNLARGFADVNTPNYAVSELLISAIEQRAVLAGRILKLKEEKEGFPRITDENGKENYQHHSDRIRSSAINRERSDIGLKIRAIENKISDKKRTLHFFIYERLHNVIPHHVMNMAVQMAKQDMKEYNESIALIESGDKDKSK